MKLVPKKYQSLFYEKIFPKVGYFLINAVFSTIRMRWHRDAVLFEYKKKNKPVIFALWHNRLAYTAYGYSRILKKNSLVTMNSRSKDGKIFAGIIQSYGLNVVYGSSSRDGSKVLLEIIRFVKDKNMDCGITPDGPRGPKYKVQPGVISIAQSTGAPIIPLIYDVKWKMKLKSWDGFYIPIPFTWGIVNYGEPIFVPEKITDEERMEYQKKLEDVLNSLCKENREWIKNRGKFTSELKK